MAKILVDFQLSHGQEHFTQGNIVVDLAPGNSNLHDQVKHIIARQFNCPETTISITRLELNG
jgi:hypothetical protein